MVQMESTDFLQEFVQEKIRRYKAGLLKDRAGMDRVANACRDCQKRCLVFHEKVKNPSFVASSFFKVMIGDHFLGFLSIPPKFACQLLPLVGQETFLEDLNGRRWRVKLSNLNGSLVFLDGWNAFAMDKRIALGDFLIFNYIKGSHFFVIVYDNTGCEKPDLTRNLRNRANFDRIIDRSLTNIHDKRGEVIDVERVVDVGGSSRHGKANMRQQVITKEQFLDASLYMVNREPRGDQRDQLCIKDLSIMENGHLHDPIPPIQKPSTGVEMGWVEASSFVKSAGDKNICGNVFTPSTMSPVRIQRDEGELSDGVQYIWKNTEETNKVQPRQKQKVLNQCSLGHSLRGQTTGQGEVKGCSDAWLKVQNTEDVHNTNLVAGDCKLLGAVVKLEPGLESSFQDNLTLPGNAVNISCLVPEVDPNGGIYLELPGQLPFIPERARIKLPWKLVILRDQEERLWPVIYDESVKKLTGGFETFMMANNVKVGGEHVLGIESYKRNEWRVSIGRTIS